MPNTIHTWVRRCGMLWRWARGERAHRLTETVAGLPADLVSDTMRQIARWGLPLVDSPQDALSYQLRDHGMPAYVEPYANTLARIREFTTWIPRAGSTSMLEVQAEWAGLVNPVVVSVKADTEFSITADNAGFQPRWGDPGLTWGDGYPYGHYVPPDIAKNLRALMRFFRPARERFTGVAPTYWTPALLAPESWIEAKHGTIDAGRYSSFADQGIIGGQLVPVTASPIVITDSVLAEFSTDVAHSKTPNAFRDMNGQTDGFWWWAGYIPSSESVSVAFANDSAVIFDESKTFAAGYYVVIVSVDTSEGSHGGVTTYVNGLEDGDLGGTFSAAPATVDPSGTLTVGARSSGAEPGLWHAFGWVRGRPAIAADVALLQTYYTAETTDDPALP